jgi:H+/Cl- antiporter ClcA
MRWSALAPGLVAALVGDLTTRALGIGHTHYPRVAYLALGPVVLLKWAVFAVAVAATSSLFIELTHGIKHLSEKRLGSLAKRMFVGGLVVVLLWKLTGTNTYLGLGVPTIVRAFHDPALPNYVFALKLLFTAITIGTGFIGGEVTPLFFVGATLGCAFGAFLGLPIELAAAVGMTSLFACAAKTPFAIMFMAVELFGINCLPHVALVSAIAYVLGGERSIYAAQRAA